MTIEGVTRELLVRYLDTWTPAALHAAKRATFACAFTGPVDVAIAEAALRVFAEFDDLLRGRRLTYVMVAPDLAEAAGRLDAVQAELHTPANLAVHAAAGAPADLLAAALSAAGSTAAPLLVFAQTDTPLVRVASAGRPVELLSIRPGGDWPAQRAALTEAGFSLTAGVEFIDGTPGGGATGRATDRDTTARDTTARSTAAKSTASPALLSFATGSAKSLEAFKNALWSVDEYAGVRYRDPNDADGHVLDISLDPHPGPLRRALLAHLAEAGPRTVTELRHFALTDTVYRAADATKVMHTLVNAGTVTSNGAHGRLAGDVLISPAAKRA